MKVGESTERLDETDRNTNRSFMVLRGILPGDTTNVPLSGSRIVLGRGSEATVQLEWRGISRRHTEIYRQGPVHALRDLDSTNGTFVNGERVQHCAAAAGTLLRIGDWLGLFEDFPSTDAPRRFGDLGSGIFGGDTLYGALEPLLRSARAKLPVVLVGETGTGKERFARALHDASGQKGPFHAINCAALADQLADA
ncbi:MAG TPA: FHA domain-containing protein, partial [Polyangiaceae bacterium]